MMPGCFWKGCVLWLACLALAGCNGATVEDIKQAATDAVDQVQETVTTGAQDAVAAGSMTLTAGEPLSAAGCYGRLTPFPFDGPTVFEITSYADPSAEAFPSVYIRALVSKDDAAALAGKAVQAQILFQREPGGPVWESATGTPVELTITTADGTTIAGSFVSGRVMNVETGEAVDITGTFTGTFH